MGADVTDPREDRLPKWAREELHRLRRDLETERKVTEELKGNNPDSNTFLIDYGRKDAPLPRNSRIGFHVRPDDGTCRQAIQVYVENRRLRVQGDYSLIVRMGASNSFTVELEGYR
jgi:hypothetical protein